MECTKCKESCKYNFSGFHQIVFDIFSVPVSGKNLEYGLKQEGLLSFVRELNGNDEEQYDNYLRDASMYARGNECSGMIGIIFEYVAYVSFTYYYFIKSFSRFKFLLQW